ncbi:MAG TPA: cobalamin-dependent protein [Polyangia bacterium]|jgi:methanogenic corrinoid protein MtbC1
MDGVADPRGRRDATAPAGADLRHHFTRALLTLDGGEARRLLELARAGRPAVEVIEAVIAPALEQLGHAWEAGTVALSQVYMGGRLCEELVNALLPALDEAHEAHPPIAMATLEDYHLLGKRIVLSALRASGFTIRDYGQGTAEEIGARAVADGLDILLVSTLMLPSALRVKELRALLARGGCRARLVVGGAPFRLDALLGPEVGADAVGTNTAEALAIVRRLTGRRA